MKSKKRAKAAAAKRARKSAAYLKAEQVPGALYDSGGPGREGVGKMATTFARGDRVTVGDGAAAVLRRSMSATVVRMDGDGYVRVAIDPERQGDAPLHLRCPQWALTRTLEPRR